MTTIFFLQAEKASPHDDMPYLCSITSCSVTYCSVRGHAAQGVLRRAHNRALVRKIVTNGLARALTCACVSADTRKSDEADGLPAQVRQIRFFRRLRRQADPAATCTGAMEGKAEPHNNHPCASNPARGLTSRLPGNTLAASAASSSRR